MPSKNSSSPLKLIVVGLGLIGPRHAEQIQLNPDAELIGFVDPSPKAGVIAKRFKVPLYESLSQLLFSGLKPDAAYVCTPNSLHIKVAMELASNGIHMLIEKPLSTNLQEAVLLKNYAVSKGVKILVGHHRRFNPYILIAKKNLEKLGQIVAIDGVWTLKKNDTYFKQVEWRNLKSQGGGAIMINLVHDLDLLQYLLGPITRVYADYLPKNRTATSTEDQVDEGCVCTLSFQSGAKGTFIVSDNVISPFNFEMGTGENPIVPKVESTTDGIFYRIFGTNGTLTIPNLKLYNQGYLEREGKEKGWYEIIQCEELSVGEDIEGIPFALQLNHFLKMMKDEEAPKCTVDDGISVLLVVEAIVESLETGMPQTVKSVDSIC